jgi:hypothetical protein
MLGDNASENSLIMEDKLQVIDRLIKIEALEHKMGLGKSGSAFDEGEE